MHKIGGGPLGLDMFKRECNLLFPLTYKGIWIEDEKKKDELRDWKFSGEEAERGKGKILIYIRTRVCDVSIDIGNEIRSVTEIDYWAKSLFKLNEMFISRYMWKRFIEDHVPLICEVLHSSDQTYYKFYQRILPTN